MPFYIRGPGIPKGHEEDAVSTHIDLAPTFFELAGIPQRDDFDGTPLPTIPNSRGKRHEHVTVEFWGKATLEGSFAGVGRFSGVFLLPFQNCYSGLTIVKDRTARQRDPTTRTNPYVSWVKDTTCTILCGAPTSMNYMT